MYQYPTRPGAAPPPAAAQASAFGQPAPQQPYVPPPPPVVAPGHPANSVLFTCASGSVTTLRLKAAEAIRLQPPVPISSVLLAETGGAQSLPQPDLSLERKLLGEADAGTSGAGSAGSGSAGGAPGAGSAGGAAGGGGKGAGSSSASTSSDVEAFMATIQAGAFPRDPSVAVLSADKGASSQAALLGLAYARGGRGGTDKAGDFASKLDQMTGMGFPLAMAAGALAKHGNDVEAATESCLAISS